MRKGVLTVPCPYVFFPGQNSGERGKCRNVGSCGISRIPCHQEILLTSSMCKDSAGRKNLVLIPTETNNFLGRVSDLFRLQLSGVFPRAMYWTIGTSVRSGAVT